MATILEFRILPGRNRVRLSQAAEQAACKIVIFPGIRVAYWDDAIKDSNDTPPRSSGRKSAKQKRPRS